MLYKAHAGLTMATSEVRTQIYLPRTLHSALRHLAKTRGVSMAQVLREAAEAAVVGESTRKDPLGDLIGVIADAPKDLSVNHDHHLYGARKKRP